MALVSLGWPFISTIYLKILSFWFFCDAMWPNHQDLTNVIPNIIQKDKCWIREKILRMDETLQSVSCVKIGQIAIRWSTTASLSSLLYYPNPRFFYGSINNYFSDATFFSQQQVHSNYFLLFTIYFTNPQHFLTQTFLLSCPNFSWFTTTSLSDCYSGQSTRGTRR